MNSADNIEPIVFDGDRLSHAYIVSGDHAETLTMAVVCSGPGTTKPCMICKHCDKTRRGVHPDITIVDKPPDKREILVSQIRALKKDVIVIPIESDKKAYVINDADLMNTEAQNAFLQILEEPPSHAVFILKTENPAALLPTVLSRCVTLRAMPSREHSGTVADEMTDAFFDALDKGNLPLTAFMFRLEKLDRDSLTAFIKAARDETVVRLKSAYYCENGAPGIPDAHGIPGAPGIPGMTLVQAEKSLIRAQEMLDLNVNAGHISGMICASLMNTK